MKIYIVKETTIDEKRVSLVPDVAKKFIKDGFDVFLEKDAGYMSKFTDEDYSSLGVSIDDNHENISDADSPFLTTFRKVNAPFLVSRTSRHSIGALKRFAKPIAAFVGDPLVKAKSAGGPLRSSSKSEAL